MGKSETLHEAYKYFHSKLVDQGLFFSQYSVDVVIDIASPKSPARARMSCHAIHLPQELLDILWVLFLLL